MDCNICVVKISYFNKCMWIEKVSFADSFSWLDVLVHLIGSLSSMWNEEFDDDSKDFASSDYFA